MPVDVDRRGETGRQRVALEGDEERAVAGWGRHGPGVLAVHRHDRAAVGRLGSGRAGRVVRGLVVLGRRGGRSGVVVRGLLRRRRSHGRKARHGPDPR
ncbi:hypothetical protein GCM10009633_21150 [Janibacter melonis]